MKLYVFSLFILFFGVVASAEVVEKIVAIVNDEIITKQDLDTYKKQLQRGKFIDDLLMNDTDKSKILKDQASLVDHMVDERIIDSEVKREDLSVTIEKVDQEIRKVSEANHMSKAQLSSEVQKEGISFAEYQQFIKQRLERQALVQKAISSKIKITDDEVQNYYLNHNRGSNVNGYEYSVAHILFLPKGGDKDAARARAQSVLDKLNKGESFETLASQYSEDPNYTNGGFLGNFKSGESLKEIEVAVKPLAPGEHSGLVSSKLGYHIVKLLAKKITNDPEYEAEVPKIRNILYEIQFKQQFKFWIAQKRQASFIKINK